MIKLSFEPELEACGEEATKRTMANKRKMTMGLIVGNRGFFPAHLAKSGRDEMTAVLQKAGMDVVVLDPEQSKHGAVETYEEAKTVRGVIQIES